MISRADLSRPANQGVSTPRGARPLRTRTRERLPWAYLAAFFLGTALVSTFIWYQIESERQVVLANWQARVTAIAEGRARLVSDWIEGFKDLPIQPMHSGSPAWMPSGSWLTPRSRHLLSVFGFARRSAGRGWSWPGTTST